MAKIFSSELHGNDNASLEFDAAVIGAVRRVRQNISILVKSRKADEYAPGAIHALRKLCEGEGKSGHIYQVEVEEWKECFFAWFNRVKRWFPDDYADIFQVKAEDDFRVIFECSSNVPEFLWRNEVDECSIRVTFKNEKALKDAYKAAESKHPVQLGSALHRYIERCIATLVEEPIDEEPAASVSPDSLQLMLAPRLVLHDDDMISLCLDRFDCFDSPDDLAQDIAVNAYDVEEAVQNYLNKHSTESASNLEFDSESSMFCVRSALFEALAVVVEVLIRFATDHEVFSQYRQPQ